MADILVNLTDPVARRQSLLPGWTVGHVITHLARNAQAMHRQIQAAQRGELIEQYRGGASGRAAEIDAGALRSAADIIDDAMHWAGRLDELFAGLPDSCWALPVRTIRGNSHPIALLPLRRWREAEVHLVDLDLGFGPGDWPRTWGVASCQSSSPKLPRKQTREN